MSIESVMSFNHLILCRPLLLLPSIFPSIRVFSNKSVLHIRWPKCWSFTFSISPSNEHSGLISFRMDWLDCLAVVAYFLITAGENNPHAPGLKSWWPLALGAPVQRPAPGPSPRRSPPGLLSPSHQHGRAFGFPLTSRAQRMWSRSTLRPGIEAHRDNGPGALVWGHGSQRKGDACRPGWPEGTC